MTLEYDVIDRFATRPTLRPLAIDALREALRSQFPSLNLDPDHAWIRQLAGPDDASQTLSNCLLQALADNRTVVLDAAAQGLFEHNASQPLSLDVVALATTLNAVILQLPERFSRSLVAFWGKADDTDESPMQWLSGQLKQRSIQAAVADTSVRSVTDDLFGALAAHPCKRERSVSDGAVVALRAGIPGYRSAITRHETLVPLLVGLRPWAGRPHCVSESLDGQRREHPSMEALFAAAATLVPEMPKDAQWFLYEPDGDVFEAWAKALLDYQLNDIRRLRDIAFGTIDEVELFLAAVTDPAPYVGSGWLTDHASRLAAHMPDWLRAAGAADRQAYGDALRALAVAQHKAGGQAFDDGIAPIARYTAECLQQLIEADHLDAEAGLVSRVRLKVAKVVATPVPVGGSFIPAGAVDKVTLSLVDFALANLASLPHGHAELVADDGQPLPSWLTVDYAKQLVARADIGARYPQLIRRLLRDDAAEATRRRALFRDQLRLQLPLRALEQKIRGQGAVDEAGCRQVQRLMTGAAALRPLAFESQPGATADVVEGLFVIGDREPERGPMLLYRPFNPLALMQFDRWEALRQAIVAPGPLQDEVLAWLPEAARRTYANGGFDEPHIVRVGMGSEYAPIDTPAPARLATEQVRGDVLDALFDACVQALVTLAERDSVSNAEDRWATLQEGGWQLLSALLPLFSGEVATVVWLGQLMDMAEQLLQHPTEQAQALDVSVVAPVLLTVASFALHSSLAPDTPFYRRAAPVDELPLMPVPGHLEGAETAVLAEIDATRTVLEPAATTLDFTWSSSARPLTTHERARLAALQVASEPVPLSEVPDGARRGLLQHADQHYVRLGKALYRVRFLDDGARIAAPSELTPEGPWLARDPDGGWRIDLSLRLRGGMPKKNMRQLAEESLLRRIRLVEELKALGERMNELRPQYGRYLKQMETAKGEVRELFLRRMETHLVDMIGVMRQALEKNGHLRVGDRIDTHSLGASMVDVICAIEAFEAYLTEDLLSTARGEITDDGVPKAEITPDNVDAYRAMFHRLLGYQNQGVRWSTERNALMNALREIPIVGDTLWRERMLEQDEANLYSESDWRISRLWALLELSFGREHLLSSEEVQPLFALREDEALHQALRSHAELERPNDYSNDEQTAVLESALREYARAVDVATLTLEQGLPGTDADSLQQFISELGVISDAATSRLAELVREHVEPAKPPKRRVPNTHRSNTRIIRTRSHKTVVGRVRTDSGGLPGDVVEVVERDGTHVLGTYHRHASGEWVQVEVAKSAASPGAKPLVPFAELRNKASRLLGEVDSAIAVVQRQARRAQEPEDMEDILVHKAEKLEGLALEMRRHRDDGALNDSETAALDAQSAALDQAAARLRQEGQQVRIAMIKAQPPTAARVSYLSRVGKVQIATFNRRQNMSGKKHNDYLQEFAIRDADDPSTILWWAHFHYASEQAPPGDYTAAHLKLPAQRKLGYKALVRMAQDNGAVVQIYRSAIGRELAQRLFLVLTPGVTAVS